MGVAGSALEASSSGPFQGSMFLVAVDAHSKWPEVHVMKETTAAKTIDVLRIMFSSFGLPEQLVTTMVLSLFLKTLQCLLVRMELSTFAAPRITLPPIV